MAKASEKNIEMAVLDAYENYVKSGRKQYVAYNKKQDDIILLDEYDGIQAEYETVHEVNDYDVFFETDYEYLGDEKYLLACEDTVWEEAGRPATSEEIKNGIVAGNDLRVMTKLEAFDCLDMRDTVNEVVDRVNELSEAY